MNMTIDYAVKNNKAVELSLDNYKLADGRVVKYDRYCKGNRRWRIIDDGVIYAYKNFSDCYYDVDMKVILYNTI